MNSQLLTLLRDIEIPPNDEEAPTSLMAALTALEVIDEVAIVAAPGVTTKPELNQVIAHCAKMKDRVAVLDGPMEPDSGVPVDLTGLATVGGPITPDKSDFAAYYYPWIKVSDPTTNGIISVPPSGHVAGVYARVDATRGVHKAPANEAIRGIAGVARPLSKEDQNGLNPHGINCIRDLNGAATIWGARTLGGDLNTEVKYISVRRLLCYLAKSIDQGTQWVVFEPNTKALWGKIRRNIGAFLTEVWSSGALFGDTPAQAFYVKCDEETNPPSVRDNGLLVTEIGVAVSKPAEFVVFRLSQWTGGGAS